jgi:hypothetical protein
MKTIAPYVAGGVLIRAGAGVLNYFDFVETGKD